MFAKMPQPDASPTRALSFFGERTSGCDTIQLLVRDEEDEKKEEGRMANLNVQDRCLLCLCLLGSAQSPQQSRPARAGPQFRPGTRTRGVTLFDVAESGGEDGKGFLLLLGRIEAN